MFNESQTICQPKKRCWKHFSAWKRTNFDHCLVWLVGRGCFVSFYEFFVSSMCWGGAFLVSSLFLYILYFILMKWHGVLLRCLIKKWKKILITIHEAYMNVSTQHNSSPQETCSLGIGAFSKGVFGWAVAVEKSCCGLWAVSCEKAVVGCELWESCCGLWAIEKLKAI